MRFDRTPYTLIFENGADYPSSQPVELFQVSDRTAAGPLQVETLGVKVAQRVLNFNLMTKTDYEGLLNWFLNITQGGYYTFTFTDEYGEVGDVRFINSKIDFRETSFQRYSGQVTLEYIDY